MSPFGSPERQALHGNARLDRVYHKASHVYSLKITYLGFDGKLIYAHEFPRCNDSYFDWGKIVENSGEEHTIYCNALNLRKALDAAGYAEDHIISINIPEDKLKPIRLA